MKSIEFRQMQMLTAVTFAAVLLAGLLLLLRAMNAPAPARLDMRVYSVVTERPQLCVHTRLIDEVEMWKIEQTLKSVRLMGASTIVEFFPWSYLEPQRPGEYRWRQADLIFDAARRNGIRIIARLGLVPEWVQRQAADANTEVPDADRLVSNANTLSPLSYQQFADFSAAFARRYASHLDAIVVWNEPNLSFEWGYRTVDPVQYTELLRAVYTAVNKTAPAVSVLGGALAPTLEQPGSTTGLDDLIYLQAMLEAGAADAMDGLAVHTYGLTQPADQPPDARRINFRRVELLHDLLSTYHPGMPITITEMGWNDHPRWQNAVRPSQRIQYTIDALRRGEGWPWLTHACLWVFRLPAESLSYRDRFSLISPDFVSYPIYDVLVQYAQDDDLPPQMWLPPPIDTDAAPPALQNDRTDSGTDSSTEGIDRSDDTGGG